MKWFKGITKEKDPADVIDYPVDFGPLLQTDTISTATVVGTNVTINSSSTSGNIVTVWVSGGTHGCTGEVKITIVTAGGRTFERTFNIKVEDK